MGREGAGDDATIGGTRALVWNGLWRESGGVGRGLRQRRGEEALHRVEWLDALVCSTQDKGALESREEYGGIVLCG
jgi:hypothetical protein